MNILETMGNSGNSGFAQSARTEFFFIWDKEPEWNSK